MLMKFIKSSVTIYPSHIHLVKNMQSARVSTKKADKFWFGKSRVVNQNVLFLRDRIVQEELFCQLIVVDRKRHLGWKVCRVFKLS